MDPDSQWMNIVDGGPLARPVVPILDQVWVLERGGLHQGGAEPEHMDWTAAKDVISRWAAGLKASGIKRGDRVAILGDTSRDWVLADHAIHAIGAITVPLYPTLPADQVQFIIADAGAKAVFADEGQLPKLPDVPTHVFGKVSLDGALAKPVKVKLSDPAVIIYTSGTTGRPKGVLLSHGNIAGDVAAATVGASLDKIPEPSLVAFLPMAHIAGYVSMHAVICVGGEIVFSRPDRMTLDLAATRPTVVVAVPRLWERIVRKIEDTVAEGPAVRRFLFAKAKKAAMAHGQALEKGPVKPGGAYNFFEKLIYSKLRAKLGMDRADVAITGAAAVRPDLLWFLRGIGIPIIEGYGMSETSALNVCTTKTDWQAGTVGRPLPGFKIALAEDDEILIGGIGVFQEYWGLPEETAATRIIMEGEPWVKSGDIGKWVDGRLQIIDRKKELEVLDTGKKIAPVRVEEILKSESSFVEDACLIGTDRKYAAILIQPAFDALAKFAAEKGIKPKDVVRRKDPTGEEKIYEMDLDLLAEPAVRTLFQEAIDRTNARLADYEQVRAFYLVDKVFTVERDELTPTFKKKRRNIITNYKPEVEAMFA